MSEKTLGAPSEADADDLACIEFVELVTDYLEGGLEPDRRRQVDHHLGGCTGCRTVLEQWLEVIALSGRLDDSDVERIDPAVRATLVYAFCRAHPAEEPGS